ncbi:hypothetical protein B0J14DRAFT_360444 [Halenospora varia]|nr:hypothetical protein B0J14DRAFT_360444 [Halenospora varia]
MASSSPYEGLEATPAGLEVTPAPLRYNAPALALQPSNNNKPLPGIGSGFSQKEVALEARKGDYILGIRRKKFWVLILVTAVILVIALLCGVIGSLSHKVSTNKSISPVPASGSSNDSSSLPTSSQLSISISITSTATTTKPPSTVKSSSTVLPTLLATLVNPLSACATPSAIGPCNATDCSGMNSQNSPYGQCTSGSNIGCPCKTLCGVILGPCSGCDGQLGVCFEGMYKGCGCVD